MGRLSIRSTRRSANIAEPLPLLSQWLPMFFKHPGIVTADHNRRLGEEGGSLGGLDGLIGLEEVVDVGHLDQRTRLTVERSEQDFPV